MTIPLSSPTLWLLTPSTLPSPGTSNRPCLPTPSSFVLFKICLMIPLSFPVPHSPTGLLTMDTFTTRAECMFHRPLGPLCFTPSIHLPLWAISDVFALRPLLNVTFGGLDFPSLLLTSLPAVPSANRTKFAHTPSPRLSHPLNPPPPCPLNNSPSISSPIYPYHMDMTPSWSWSTMAL